MARYQMLILSRPVAGREARYNEWYESTHLGQVLALRDFTSGQRLRLARVLGERDAHPYAAIYQIETDDIDAVMKELYQAAGNGQLLIDEALDRNSIFAAVYEELGPPRAG